MTKNSSGLPDLDDGDVCDGGRASNNEFVFDIRGHLAAAASTNARNKIRRVINKSGSSSPSYVRLRRCCSSSTRLSACRGRRAAVITGRRLTAAVTGRLAEASPPTPRSAGRRYDDICCRMSAYGLRERARETSAVVFTKSAQVCTFGVRWRRLAINHFFSSPPSSSSSPFRFGPTDRRTAPRFTISFASTSSSDRQSCVYPEIRSPVGGIMPSIRRRYQQPATTVRGLSPRVNAWGRRETNIGHSFVAASIQPAVLLAANKIAYSRIGYVLLPPPPVLAAAAGEK